jgi:hypothetical protein
MYMHVRYYEYSGCRNDHNQKIRTRKIRTDVGEYTFINRAVKSWNQLPGGLLASFRCKITQKEG